MPTEKNNVEKGKLTKTVPFVENANVINVFKVISILNTHFKPAKKNPIDEMQKKAISVKLNISELAIIYKDVTYEKGF